MMTGSKLGSPRGLRVMVVEDDSLIAQHMAMMLSDIGCVVVGPESQADRAAATAGSEPLDGAVLDINLGGQTQYALIEAIYDMGIPIVLTTGYTMPDLPLRVRGCPRLLKPVSQRKLAQAVGKAFQRKVSQA